MVIRRLASSPIGQAVAHHRTLSADIGAEVVPRSTRDDQPLTNNHIPLRPDGQRAGRSAAVVLPRTDRRAQHRQRPSRDRSSQRRLSAKCVVACVSPCESDSGGHTVTRADIFVRKLSRGGGGQTDPIAREGPTVCTRPLSGDTEVKAGTRDSRVGCSVVLLHGYHRINDPKILGCNCSGQGWLSQGVVCGVRADQTHSSCHAPGSHVFTGKDSGGFIGQSDSRGYSSR